MRADRRGFELSGRVQEILGSCQSTDPIYRDQSQVLLRGWHSGTLGCALKGDTKRVMVAVVVVVEEVVVEVVVVEVRRFGGRVGEERRLVGERRCSATWRICMYGRAGRGKQYAAAPGALTPVINRAACAPWSPSWDDG